MPSLLKILSQASAAVLLFGQALDAATEIHIAPTGSDANPGTVLQPVATPQQAQELVRGLISGGLNDAVEVVFAAGTYHLSLPLELRPEDSGTAAFPITWRAADGASVVLSGGKQLTGTWTAAGDGTWYLDLTGIGLGAGQWNFRQLFVNGSRATRARFPNASAANPFLYATGGALDHAIISPALVKSVWATAPDAQINIVPQSRFFNQWNTVTAVNPSTGRIDLANSERHRTIDSGSWFWIEGVRAELDEPGEWFLDPATGRLHYMPQPGVDPNTLEFIAPYLNPIVNAKGDVNAGTHVAHVHFEGLDFRHTTFTIGHIEARVHTDTAIMFENTNDCSVKHCGFENIGGYALWLHLDSKRNAFDSNTVRHSGGGGVLLTGSRLGYMDDTKIYTPGDAAAKVAPILNSITRNTVEHCGKIRYYGGGVHLDSRPFSMSMEPGNYIAHNHFNDLSRNGVFAFRNQGGNVIEYNRIHNALQTTIDGGCIHFATMNHLNAPNFILNNWLYDAWGYERLSNGSVNRKLANGVFLDWDTSNTTVRDNWIYNTVGGAVKTIWDNWNLVVSNNPESVTPITPPFAAEVGPDGTATNGIDLATNKLTGSVIHYTKATNFSTTGIWTQQSATGLNGLFVYNFLVGTAATPSTATYTLPITESGNYQISLLYKPGTDRASNVPIAIQHANGTANVTWNMRQGNTHGFAVEVGTWHFEAGGTNTVRLSTSGTNGKVIADAVAFVKVAENTAPAASNVTISGTTVVGSTLTGNFTYTDADGDAQGATQFQWFRNHLPELSGSEIAIPGATSPTYKVTQADRGMYLVFRVTPAAATGVPTGNPVSSPSVQVPASAKFINRLSSGTPQKIVLYGTSLTATGAWVSQLQAAVAAQYPGLATWVNSGGSGKASDWGVANLQSKVLDHNPDAVFLEFSMNDAATTLNITREQALANLTTMVNSIRSARPDCEIILQLMNPVDRQPGDTLSPRPDLEPYQQDWRDFATQNGLLFIDHMPAWQAVLDQGSAAYRVHVPDGVHPTATGLSIYMTPVLLQALGIGVPAGITPEVRLRMDNRRLAEPATANGQGRNSSITAWIAEPAAAPLTIRLATTGGSASSGLDYQPLPATLVIPAGQKSASIELVTLHDEAAEPEETVQVKLLPDASYVLASPIEALVIIEASDNPPPPPTSSLLIQENFGGTGNAGLNGTGADTFDPALVSAGGNATWRAGTSFRNNGAVNSDTAQASASLDLGSFINNHKGHPNGKFVLTATISQTTHTWISLGFSQLNSPVTNQNFTHSTAGGAATIIYRAQSASPAGEFDMFPTLNQNPIDGPDGNTGARTLGVALDLTPSGGYNGTTNFGTVTWTDSVLGTVGSHTFTAAVNFGSILLSEANTSTGVVSNLTLTQFFAPPQTTYASWLAGHSPASGFEADSDQDGISNALEHVFGTDPNTRDMGIRGITKNATSLGFSHPLNPDIATDVSYGYQWSTGLAGWLPSGGTNGSGVKVEINPSSPDDDGIVTVVAMVTAGSTRGLFVRIHATLVQ